jgi:hypothetical protein
LRDRSSECRLRGSNPGIIRTANRTNNLSSRTKNFSILAVILGTAVEAIEVKTPRIIFFKTKKTERRKKEIFDKMSFNYKDIYI